jgi:hypothetical protein
VVPSLAWSGAVLGKSSAVTWSTSLRSGLTAMRQAVAESRLASGTPGK